MRKGPLLEKRSDHGQRCVRQPSVRDDDRRTRRDLHHRFHPFASDRQSCYLLLAGEAGLPLIEEQFLKSETMEYRDVFAAIIALRAVFQHSTVIPQMHVVAAMRLCLSRPKFADLVIPDLTRFKDWDSAPPVMELFRAADEKSENHWIRIPAINFMRACPRPEAKEFLAEMRNLDPDVVNRAETNVPIIKP